MNLPFDFHRTAATTMRSASFAFDLPTADESLVAAAFAILLYRYNGQPSLALDVSRAVEFGAPPWRGTMRLELSPDSSARAVLTQAAAFLSVPHVGEPAVCPEIGRVALTFGRHPELIEGRDADLHLAAGASRAAFLYNASLFKRATIERAAGHLRELLARLAAEPDALIGALPLLTPEERERIASACDGKPRAVAPEPVHQAIEARAAQAPAAVAVRHRERALTYAELNGRANALALRLRDAGVGPEARVAVCLEPSLEVPVALLAILKAGGVYVPLDPTHPETRLRALLADLRPAALVTRGRFLEKLAPAGPRVLDLDADPPLEEAADLGLPVEPSQTAYVYFTSGTTGKPKGAMASQANLAAYIASARERYGVCAWDVMPAIARYSFSISMFELLTPLCAGGTLLLLDREHVLDLERLARTLQDVTIFHMGPSLLKSLVAYIRRAYSDFSAFSKVRHASSGGDMVPPELLESLKELFPRAEVFVIYGCTEIACMGCTYPVPRDRAVERTYVGRPFDGVSVRVLDASLNVLPAGVVGEICFAGDGVVKGYLDRPDLTAERFVVLDGRRFYRTGDMGRLSEDGWVEILGRSDFQVKLRGIRVELGEIEHHLRRASGVRDGVVMPRPFGGDEKALVAYIVLDSDRPEAERAAAIEAVRRHMASHLPEYMLPAAYVELESLPLNHNMKVDRNALPAPEASRRRPDGPALREPGTQTERALAALWTRLLGVDRVGLDDRFFDLGGHSLLGLQLLVEAERELGVTIQGLELVRETLEGLAALCDARLGRAPAAVSGPPAPDVPYEPLNFGEGGSLYGVLTGASGAAPLAVLVCAPLGQDHARSHFVLQRLAARLAAKGVPSLRFDYYGCGDSGGECLEAGPARWRCDIAAARAELARRTGAKRIVAVAARLGAALLARACVDLELEAVVAWDPVCDGRRWRAETAAAHEAYVGRWRRMFRPPAPVPGATELLGLCCSDAALTELESLSFPPSAPKRPPVRWLATSAFDEQKRRFDAGAAGVAGSRFQTLEGDPGWCDAARVGDLLPDLGVSRALAKLVLEAE